MTKGGLDMFCPSCGVENENDAKFCASCGGELIDNQLLREKRSRKLRDKRSRVSKTEQTRQKSEPVELLKHQSTQQTISTEKTTIQMQIKTFCFRPEAISPFFIASMIIITTILSFTYETQFGGWYFGIHALYAMIRFVFRAELVLTALMSFFVVYGKKNLKPMGRLFFLMGIIWIIVSIAKLVAISYSFKGNVNESLFLIENIIKMIYGILFVLFALFLKNTGEKFKKSPLLLLYANIIYILCWIIFDFGISIFSGEWLITDMNYIYILIPLLNLWVTFFVIAVIKDVRVVASTVKAKRRSNKVKLLTAIVTSIIIVFAVGSIAIDMFGDYIITGFRIAVPEGATVYIDNNKLTKKDENFENEFIIPIIFSGQHDLKIEHPECIEYVETFNITNNNQPNSNMSLRMSEPAKNNLEKISKQIIASAFDAKEFNDIILPCGIDENERNQITEDYNYITSKNRALEQSEYVLVENNIQNISSQEEINYTGIYNCKLEMKVEYDYNIVLYRFIDGTTEIPYQYKSREIEIYKMNFMYVYKSNTWVLQKIDFNFDTSSSINKTQ